MTNHMLSHSVLHAPVLVEVDMPLGVELQHSISRHAARPPSPAPIPRCSAEPQQAVWREHAR